MVLLWAKSSRRVPLAPSLLLQYWLAVSMQPGSYQLQVLLKFLSSLTNFSHRSMLSPRTRTGLDMSGSR